jgi:hypothetical protein
MLGNVYKSKWPVEPIFLFVKKLPTSLPINNPPSWKFYIVTGKHDTVGIIQQISSAARKINDVPLVKACKLSCFPWVQYLELPHSKGHVWTGKVRKKVKNIYYFLL